MVPVLFWMITNVQENTSDDDEATHSTQSTIDITRNNYWGGGGATLAIQILLPVVGLALFCGQWDFFAQLLLQFDRNCVSVLCPSLSRRENLLKWAGGRLPSTWSSPIRTLSGGLADLWKDGSLLCTLINTAVPGACPNPHRHWRQPPLHAQAIAYKYLGVVPVFTDDDLSTTSGDFTLHQERTFIQYLQRLQQGIDRIASRDDANQKVSARYIARGMGLCTGEQHRKAVFYVYRSEDVRTRAAKHQADDDVVLMYIRGPYGTRGRATISTFHDDKVTDNNKKLTLKLMRDEATVVEVLPFRNQLLKTLSLDFKSLIISSDKMKMKFDDNNDDDIPVRVDKENDRMKVTYIPENNGVYEINLISDGELLRGSPFNVYVIPNDTEKKDSIEAAALLYDVDNNAKISTKEEYLGEIIDFTDRKHDINSAVSKIVKYIAEEDEMIKSDELKEENNNYNNNNKLTVINESLIVDNIDNVVNENFNNKLNININQNNLNSINESDTNDKEIFDSSPNENAKNVINNRIPDKNSSDKIMNKTSKLYIELSSAKNNLEITSPICFSHIVPTEVDQENNSLVKPYQDLNVIEKRKLFKNQTVLGLSNSSSSFSKENDEASNSNSRNSTKLEELSVLNVLDTLKQSEANLGSFSRDEERLPYLSLPNINSLDEDLMFSAKRDYFERMSSCNSSTVSVIHSDLRSKDKKKISIKSISDISGSIISSSNDGSIKSFKNRYDLRQSTNDISSSIKYYDSTDNTCRKYKSMDNSLDNCTVLTIDERKRMLLKQQYENEKIALKTRISKCLPKIEPSAKTKHESNNDNCSSPFVFSSITDRIKKFDPSSSETISVNKENPILSSSIIKEDAAIISNDAAAPLQEQKKSRKSIKSHFKRAIKYFKNLESTAKGVVAKPKVQPTTIIIDRRRYSLGCPGNNNNTACENRSKGGSLNLPNVAERFAVADLYQDIFGGGRRGSFKGAPNKKALADSLASLDRRNDVFTNNVDDDDDVAKHDETIKYNLFINRGKTRKRRTIRSLFDVNY